MFISGGQGVSEDLKAFSAAGAARYADRCTSTIRTACKYGGLRHQLVGRQIVIFKRDIDEWLSRPDVAAMRKRGEDIRSWARPGRKPEAANA
jgi:hypothetical protein